MIRISRVLTLASLLTTSGAMACLGSDSTGYSSATVEQTTFAASLGVDLPNSRRTTNGAYVRDIKIGTGGAVTTGQLLNVRYTVWLSNGTLIESNVSSTAPFAFHLGNREVIGGWDEGIPGMQIGGKRQILIPPSLGYGPSTTGNIPGNSVLVFVVEII